ncbi:hypothetical protein ACFE04_000483 [Oxalis oulophora]
MASINFNNPFGNWFNNVPKNNPIQIPPINNFTTKHPFAAINLSNLFSKSKKPEPEQPTKYEKMLDQFFWESENLPDHRHTPEVDKLLNEDPVFENKQNPTEDEVKENEKWWEEFRENPVVQFMSQAERIADKINEIEREENSIPYRFEDRKIWQSVPHVKGPDGRPMVRKAIQTRKESDDKFWDFARQFFFGLWGFRQRPYPPGRPIDVAQAIGYKRLEKRYYDCEYQFLSFMFDLIRLLLFAEVVIMRSGGFYYKDRLGRSRGPSELIQLKTAWGGGIIDENTFIWMEDMDEWAPIHMVYGLEPAIATWEVRLGAAATACLHKLQKGIPPWVPLKGFERKTYKQLQEEAVESKRRDLAVLEANGGVWPGVRIPSHALFLWAGGPELTPILEADDHMPNKYITKETRLQLQQIFPDLRPWEVLSVEQAMDQIQFGGEWHREPLGTFHTGPPYIQDWNADVMRVFEIFYDLSTLVYDKLDRTIPGFRNVMEKVQTDAASRVDKREKLRKEKAQAEKEIALFGRVQDDP